MPQPKKSPASSSGKGKSSSRSTTKRTQARASSSKAKAGSPAKTKPTSAKAKTGAKRSTAAGRAADDEEALHGHLAAVRELLNRGVVVTGDRLQETVDEAVRRGRMTRTDAEELVQSLVRISRRQTQDLLAEIEGLLDKGRSTVSPEETRRRTRERVKSVTTAARRAPGTDKALQHVDRARRVAGVGSSFPVTGYDDLTAAQVTERLAGLSSGELRKVRDHERRNANRKSVLAAIERKLD